MANSAMEFGNNVTGSDRQGQPIAPKLGRQFLLDFMAEQKQQKTAKSGLRDSSVRQTLREEFASVKRVSLVFEKSLSDRPCITSTADAISFFKCYWNQVMASDQERFVVACLDTKNRVQSIVEVTVGTLNASLVHPREVFKPAILEGSSSIILSHNHPSGNTTPSREDILVTKRLTDVGNLIGITVLDHIVYGDGTRDAISIRECE